MNPAPAVRVLDPSEDGGLLHHHSISSSLEKPGKDNAMMMMDEEDTDTIATAASTWYLLSRGDSSSLFDDSATISTFNSTSTTTLPSTTEANTIGFFDTYNSSSNEQCLISEEETAADNKMEEEAVTATNNTSGYYYSAANTGLGNDSDKIRSTNNNSMMHPVSLDAAEASDDMLKVPEEEELGTTVATSFPDTLEEDNSSRLLDASSTASSCNSNNDHKKTDPINYLNEQCFIHILSFVWGDHHQRKEEEESGSKQHSKRKSSKSSSNTTTAAVAAAANHPFGLNAYEIFTIYNSFASISHGWEEMMGNVIVRCIQQPLLVQFDSSTSTSTSTSASTTKPDDDGPILLSPQQANIRFATWLCKYRFSIKSIIASCSSSNSSIGGASDNNLRRERERQEEEERMISQILQDCETTSLEACSLSVSCLSSVLVAADHHRHYNGESTNHHHHHHHSQSLPTTTGARHLLDTVANECPNLKQLSLELVMIPNATTGCGQKQEWTATKATTNLLLGDDPNFISKLIQNLPSLKDARIMSSESSRSTTSCQSSGIGCITDVSSPASFVFRVASKTLQSLAVDSFCSDSEQDVIRFALNCPNLKFCRLAPTHSAELLTEGGIAGTRFIYY